MTRESSPAAEFFLLDDLTPESVFTPEDFSTEQRQIAEVTRQFAQQSVAPLIEQIEHKNLDVLRRLLEEAGDLGLLAVDVPEAYGGLQLTKVTSALIAEWVSVCASFTVTLVAHSGIGMLPLIWFGTPQQKERYLPKLATGRYIGAYALSESTSGSDALNIRTTAVLSEDGSHYVLNGEKMWISNAGIADLFTVFAKVDGTQFSAFLVETQFMGVSIGKEENKMGIRGSSTCSVSLRDCKVPSENLLGEVGKGHHIAFNVLNIGRCKLGAMVLGGARYALEEAICYGKQRTAFGKPITDFGLIREKIAESASLIYVAEAMLYRTVGSIDSTLRTTDASSPDYARAVQKHISKYAVESSIVKVWCSEMQTTVVDHALQIYGGYGFTEDYPAARHYRDARITRIFEGTNEINRLIITSWTAKRVAEKLPAFTGDKSPTFHPNETESVLTEVSLLLRCAKQTAHSTLLLAMETYGEEFSEEQELAGAFSDVIAEIYALESALLRACKNPCATSENLVAYYATASKRKVASALEKIASCLKPKNDSASKKSMQMLLECRTPDAITTGRSIAQAVLAK